MILVCQSFFAFGLNQTLLITDAGHRSYADLMNKPIFSFQPVRPESGNLAGWRTGAKIKFPI
jgi:hypothetical protein